MTPIIYLTVVHSVKFFDEYNLGKTGVKNFDVHSAIITQGQMGGRRKLGEGGKKETSLDKSAQCLRIVPKNF